MVLGDASVRRAAAEAALASRDGERVVHVGPAEGPARPWSGLALVLGALAAGDERIRIPLALDAAAAGAGTVVGDHVGLGADLRAVLASAVDAGPVLLVVEDAHRLDLSSAAALDFALTRCPPGVRAVITQAGRQRGFRALPSVGEPDEHEVAAEGHGDDAHAAAAVGALLDAAWRAEQIGDLVLAARWWLDGGRPDRCAEALARVQGSAAADDVTARLVYVTRSFREWRCAVDDAVDGPLAEESPADAARLLLLAAAARVGHGDLAGADEVAGRCTRLLDSVDGYRERRPVAELVSLVVAAREVSSGTAPAALLDAVERPLARFGAVVDPDAVRLLSTASMALGRSGHLGEARTLLDRVIGVLHSRHRFLVLPQPLATSAWLARRRSRLDVALADGARAIELGRAAGAVNDIRLATAEVAHVEAMQGRLEDCRAHVAELVPDGIPRGAAQLGAVSALAVGELLADTPEEAVRLLEPIHARSAGSAPPSQTAWRHSLVEAYVRTGRRRDALAVLHDLEQWVAENPSPLERGQVAWGRGMVAEPGQHDQHFREARELLRPYPALRWRCEVHHARRMLEEGRTVEAVTLAERLVLEAATAGVPSGAEHVRRMLVEHGVTSPASVAATDTSQLSVDDLRIAIALVEGADDDEIANRLQVSARGVDDARERVLGALGVDAVDQLRALLPLESAVPGTTGTEVRILGPTTVVRGTRHSVPPAGRPAMLLALVAAERSVPVDRVLDVLWPDDDPMRARPRLRNVLARLRAAVGPVVARDGELLVLEHGVVVDAHRFDELAEQALHAPAADVERRAEEVVRAWTGVPLPAWPYEDWAVDERRRLVHRCVAVLVRRAEIRAGADVSAALDDLELALILDPDAHELWQRAIDLAEADERVGRARALRRRAADRDIELH